MADIFLSYRNTPDHRRLLRRLVLFLKVHDFSVWWDYGLEAGDNFEQRIFDEIDRASVIIPCWCFESVYRSKWVMKEAERGREKLFPIRLQAVSPPKTFAHIHSFDLVEWDGDTRLGMLDALLVTLWQTLGRPVNVPVDLRSELATLPLFDPFPRVDDSYEEVLGQLRTGFIHAAAVNVDDAMSVTFGTPISDLMFWNKMSLADNIHEIFDRGRIEEVAIDDGWLEDMSTVGDLIAYILEWQTNRDPLHPAAR